MNNLYNVFKVLLGIAILIACGLTLTMFFAVVQHQFKINDAQVLLNQTMQQRLQEGCK